MKQEREFFDSSDVAWTAAPGSPGVVERVLSRGEGAIPTRFARPIGMPHGPYRTESGCIMLETRYQGPSR